MKFSPSILGVKSPYFWFNTHSRVPRVPCPTGYLPCGEFRWLLRTLLTDGTTSSWCRFGRSWWCEKKWTTSMVVYIEVLSIYIYIIFIYYFIYIYITSFATRTGSQKWEELDIGLEKGARMMFVATFSDVQLFDVSEQTDLGSHHESPLGSVFFGVFFSLLDSYFSSASSWMTFQSFQSLIWKVSEVIL